MLVFGLSKNSVRNDRYLSALYHKLEANIDNDRDIEKPI